MTIMKSTPDQAIYDFSNAIYKISRSNFYQIDQPLEKAKFLVECLKVINELKMEEGRIIHKNQTVIYWLNEVKYSLWLVETPEPTEKFAFLDYLTHEMTAIFYNQKPDASCR